jgi:hypothetical protein
MKVLTPFRLTLIMDVFIEWAYTYVCRIWVSHRGAEIERKKTHYERPGYKDTTIFECDRSVSLTIKSSRAHT